MDGEKREEHLNDVLERLRDTLDDELDDPQSEFEVRELISYLVEEYLGEMENQREFTERARKAERMLGRYEVLKAVEEGETERLSELRDETYEFIQDSDGFLE